VGKIIGHGKIRDKGVVTLPKEVRNYLGVDKGDFIILIEESGQIVIKKGELKASD